MNGSSETDRAGMFELHEQGDTLVLVPVADLDELRLMEIQASGRAVLARLGSSPIRNVIVDFGRTDYFGSTAMGFLIRFWKRIRERQGRMVLCCPSAHERELLELSRLDGIWPIYASREEALAAVRV